ncbi:3-carboxy-cis,cis-muconate cycloisomerase [Streptomyces sp. LX-29]|uniref:3-carboxy-cis,cis-muconate cycloisomerase n=1 Tax=Streptomyces sp. LX-29 TaxID=2900152 RepID=UPI00240D51D9|nr:3-carboxy-cis,cis-muconate cycloisomerase [Streptomyces sp. LX-29]WFB10766.1 3-carboxy-cis,cis-muconate cycloisomerase [Streptomyces sp. LX-29]
MNSRADRTDAPVDAGLLSPVRAGTPVERVVDDEAWLAAMLDAEAALARAQARLGTVPPKAAETITEVARAGGLDVRALAVAARESANPVVALVRMFTEAVAAADPTAAEYVHRGSTSQDVFDTAAMLVARRAVRLIREDLRRTAHALARLAAEHRDTVMAGRTLALHAVPVTFGLKAAGWRQLVRDADDRLARVERDGLPVSLGGAAGTLAGYLEYARLDSAALPEGSEGAEGCGGFDPAGYAVRLADAFADETGLARPRLPWHALRTPIADLAAALGFTAGALGKIAADVQTLARTEIGEVAEPAVAGRGASSAMPHKRNPVLATLVRSAALQVPALAGGLTQLLVSEDERSAGGWHAEWLLLRECLRLVGGAGSTMAELAEGIEVRPERMHDNLRLTGGQVVSERVSAVLAPKLGRTAAKRLLDEASTTARRTGRPLAEALGRLSEIAGVLTAEELAELCAPERYIGAAATLVDRALSQPDAHPADQAPAHPAAR